MATAPKAATEPANTQTDVPLRETDRLPGLLAAVSAEVGAIRKDGRAPQVMGGYAFRGVDAVVNAVHPILTRYGIVLLPEVLEVNREPGTTNKGAAIMTVSVRTRFTFHGPAGDSLSLVTAGEAMDSGDKATTKAQSVALRVALLQALLLPTDEPDVEESTMERGTGHLARAARDEMRTPERPAYQRPFWDALNALSADQQAWVRANWPSPTQPADMTVEDTAKAVEWMAANVPPA